MPVSFHAPTQKKEPRTNDATSNTRARHEPPALQHVKPLQIRGSHVTSVASSHLAGMWPCFVVVVLRSSQFNDVSFCCVKFIACHPDIGSDPSRSWSLSHLPGIGASCGVVERRGHDISDTHARGRLPYSRSNSCYRFVRMIASG